MPPIFKALATLSAWVLFVLGWLNVVPSIIFVVPMVGVEPPPIDYYLGIGLGAACFILAVVVMKLRQMLE